MKIVSLTLISLFLSLVLHRVQVVVVIPLSLWV